MHNTYFIYLIYTDCFYINNQKAATIKIKTRRAEQLAGAVSLDVMWILILKRLIII